VVDYSQSRYHAGYRSYFPHSSHRVRGRISLAGILPPQPIPDRDPGRAVVPTYLRGIDANQADLHAVARMSILEATSTLLVSLP